MPISNLTKERRDKLLAELDAIQVEIRQLEETSCEQTWTEELDALEAAYDADHARYTAAMEGKRKPGARGAPGKKRGRAAAA